MTTVLLCIGIFGIFFIFMSVRLLFLKGGEFKGTCASQNPFLNTAGEDCFCGKKVGDCKTDGGNATPPMPQVGR